MGDFLPKSPLFLAEGDEEKGVLCVWCVVRERVSKIERKRECRQLKNEPKRERAGKEKEEEKREK